MAKLTLALLLSVASLTAQQEFVKVPKATKIPPKFYELPKLEEPKAVVIEEPEPLPPPEPEKPPVVYHDPKEDIAKQKLEELRIGRRKQRESIPIVPIQTSLAVEPYQEDAHYRIWDDRVLEDKFTYPVNREWTLTAGQFISGLLQTGINSSIGGTAIILVTQPVFADEGYKLIFPVYTRLICEYQPLAKVSDTRLQLKCLRAIRPDGASLLLTQAYGTDAMGRNGLVGEIDHRTLEKYGSAFTMSLISSLAGASHKVSNSTVVQNTADNLSHNLGQVTAKIIEQYIDLAPVITIDAGTRVHLLTNTDIWLRKPISREEALALQQTNKKQGERP